MGKVVEEKIRGGVFEKKARWSHNANERESSTAMKERETPVNISSQKFLRMPGFVSRHVRTYFGRVYKTSDRFKK